MSNDLDLDLQLRKLKSNTRLCFEFLHLILKFGLIVSQFVSARGRTSKCCTQTNKQTKIQTNRQTERSNILAKMFFRQVMNLNGAGL